MLDFINSGIRSKTNPNQWTNTADVLNWFTELEDKETLTFIVFDIVDFYPSISIELLSTCLDWAKKFTTVRDDEVETIMHARRTLLYDNNNKAWEKQKGRN